ncbi:MAG TPA: glycosyltransferase family 4 protein [Bacteroidia bacterium]|nr:glycosyltransferase family 4 protein [Bacteroidia bacterium]
MKVLQICSKIPFPAKDGGCLAMLNLAEMLHMNGVEIKILAMETTKHPILQGGFPLSWKQKFNPETYYIDTHINILKAIKNLFFSKRSFHIVRFESAAFEIKLKEILKKYKPDIVIFDSLFTCSYLDTIAQNSSAKKVYRAHNIEHLIWKEIANKTASFFKKYYLNIQSQRLKDEEMLMIKKCDAIIAITRKDHDFFHQHFDHKPIFTLPFTIDLSQYNISKSSSEKTIFFIGAMDWYPNLEGVNWFIDKVWKKLLMKHPTAKFYLAGKSMPEKLKQLESINIFNLGEVENAKSFMGKYPIMVAPIFSGGGLKIKIVEAMALGKIVICNPQAATGIDAKPFEHLLFAHSSNDFVDLLDGCFSRFDQYKQIGENARSLISKQFDSKMNAAALDSFLMSIP